MIDKTIQNYKLYNLPVEYQMQDYDNAIDNYLKVVTKIPGVVSVFQEGKVYAPGLSDIDLVVVVKDGYIGQTRDFLIDPKNKKEMYLFYNQPRVVEVSYLKNYSNIHTPFLWKHLWGKDYKLSKPNNSENLTILLDVVLGSYPTEFLKPLILKQIDVRLGLARLNGMRYAGKLLGLVSKKKLNLSITDSVDDLRANWFSISHKERMFKLLSLLESGLELSYEIVEVSRELTKNLSITEVESCGFFKQGTPLIFTRDWSRDRAAKEIENNLNSNGFFTNYLPLELSLPLIAYREKKTELGNYIKSNFYSSRDNCIFTIPQEFVPIYELKASLIDLNYSFVTKNSLDQGIYADHGLVADRILSRRIHQKLSNWWKRRRFIKTNGLLNNGAIKIEQQK